MNRLIEGEIVINRPVEEVFDFVANECNEPRYNPRMRYAEQTSRGTVGLGTSFQAEMRTMGRTAAMTIELTEYQPPRKLGSSTHLSNMDIDGSVCFDPVAGGTQLRWSWALKPHGGLRMLTPMIARVGRHQEQTIWSNLKRLLEAPAAPAQPLRR
jgi:uncharacterized protein YndB with AHSA1/START domain